MRRRSLLAGLASGATVGLAGCLGATQYVVTDARVESDPSPLDVAVSIGNPNAVIQHPASLTFTLTNTSQRPIHVRNIGIWPLGLLKLSPAPTAENAKSGPSTILWNTAYETSPHVTVHSRSAYGTDRVPLTKPVRSGSSVSATYQIHGDDVNHPGTYYVYGDFDVPLLTYATADSNNFETYLPKVSVTIQQKSVLPGR